jgi:hypothetical protein
MCVACIIQAPENLPEKYIKAMAEHNPDGGGLAWIADGVLHYHKGLKWEEVYEMHKTLPRPFLMHFRIATKGGKIPELTHPFPIGMQAFTEDLKGIAERGVIIHNGTWHNFDKYVPHGIDKSKVSDTQIAAFVAETNEDILDQVNWSNAIMYPNGKIWYRGNWDKFENNLYSNLLWKWRATTTYTPRSYSQDWDGDEMGAWGNFYGNRSTALGRTTTPILSHQQNRTQENGRTVNHQTQYSKSGGVPKGQGVNTPQSNGKTIKENREAKKGKRLPGPNSDVAQNQNARAGSLGPSSDKISKLSSERAYDRAVRNYESSKTWSKMKEKDWEDYFENHSRYESIEDYLDKKYGKADKNITDMVCGEDGVWHPESWKGERLFQPEELMKPSERPTIPDLPVTKGLEKYLGPFVPCPDCGQDIKKIPCECGMDSEESLEKALADSNAANAVIEELSELEELDKMALELEVEIAGMDCNLDPDFAEIQRTIREQGIKVTSTKD